MTPAVTPPVPPDPPSIREITDLIARLRRLTAAGRAADPGERAAILADRDALIERITADDRNPDATTAGGER